ncbi:MAG: hypothetical protein ACRDOJ_09845 [Nocardioidaceae bacterium]
MTRETLYVATTRARHSTTLYVATEELLGVDADTEPGPPRTAHDVAGHSLLSLIAVLGIRRAQAPTRGHPYEPADAPAAVKGA